jgi:hypothetical protein
VGNIGRVSCNGRVFYGRLDRLRGDVDCLDYKQKTNHKEYFLFSGLDILVIVIPCELLFYHPGLVLSSLSSLDLLCEVFSWILIQSSVGLVRCFGERP